MDDEIDHVVHDDSTCSTRSQSGTAMSANLSERPTVVCLPPIGAARRGIRTVLTGGAVLLAACLAEACSVPVFRYALDHWTPDVYHIRVVHQGPLPADQAEVVQRLRDGITARFANATVDAVDLAETEDAALAERYQKADSNGAPVCLIQAPTATPGEYRDVWSGPLSSEKVDALLSSPLRDQLVKSLLEGTSVVWIYLDSGNKPVDDQSYELLESELQRLQEVIKLPEIDPVDLKELSTSPENVKLKFETLRLSRDDPQEALLVEMLLSTEPDLRDATFLEQPMAFAVFGRGRVLYSLIGEGISAELIGEACRFLTGACQCTVKAQNPGAELLLSVDWDGLIAPSLPTEVDVTLTGLAGFQSDVRPESTTAIAEQPVAPAAAPTESSTGEATADDETAAAAETPQPTEIAETDDDGSLPSITRRPTEDKPAATRPVVLISVVALLVVVASFFLLPRR
jgi:hypothetical protein